MPPQAQFSGTDRRPPPQDPAHVLSRLWTYVFLGSLTFLIYGSLVPLNYQPMPWRTAVDAFLALRDAPQGQGGSIDWASNFLLTVPISFAAGALFLPGQSGLGRLLVRGLILIGIGLISAGVEFTQQFFPPRNVSLSDIQAQALGAVAGLMGQHIWGEPVSRWLTGWWQHERSTDRLVRVLKLYLVVLAAFNLLPLDLTISPVEIYHKWSEGRIVLIPFAGLRGSLADRVYECFTDMAVWMPIGVLLSLSGRGRTLQVALIGMLLAAALESLQLFVYSRWTDITDIVLAGVGSFLGAALARPLRVPSPSRQRSEGVWYAAWAGWAVSILALFWFPFNFQLSPVEGSLLQVPFANYQVQDEYNAANEVLRKIGLFLPGGLLWGMARASRRKDGRHSRSGVGVLLVIALLVEGGQIFLPGKVADPTDVLLELLGGWLGLLLATTLMRAADQPSSPTPPPPFARAAPSPAPKASGQPRPVSARPTGLPGLGSHALAVLGLAVAIGIAVRLPGVPYNVRELVSGGPTGALSLLSLAVASYLLANAALPLGNGRLASRMLAAPLWLAASGTLVFTLLRIGVPTESMDDIVGSPVLGWRWEWERLGRFIALWMAVGLQVIGGFAAAAALGNARRLPLLLNWAIVAAVAAGPLFHVVITLAATDNLTELVGRGGSFVASALLALGLMAVALSGASLSALAVGARPRAGLALGFAAGAALAPLCFILGSEATIVKYDKVFSALQFLLSTDRGHYATGAALWLRLAAAIAVAILALSALQHLHWRSLLAGETRGRKA